MAEEEREWEVVAEVDPDGEGGSVANYASPRQADLLAEQRRKLGARALGENGPNVQPTDEEARIVGDRAKK